MHRATMVDLIAAAYNVEADNVLGGPSWLETDRFEVIATMPPSTARENTQRMMQTLLADRFHLAIHKDTTSLPAYVLTLGKGKLKMKEADGSGESGCRPQRPDSSHPYVWFVCRNTTMEALVARLRTSGGYISIPVIDRTDLKGIWNFEMGWSTLPQLQRAAGDGVSLFDAVEQQLGLKLEKQNVPMPVIVVDRVNEKPTGNPPGVSAKLPPSATEFEVASLKLSAPGEEPGGGGFLNGGRVDLKGFPLRGLITLAWDIHPGMDIVGEPKWLNSAAVDLVAKVSSTVVPADTRLTMSDIQPMLRELLEDRFRIRTHYEDRPLNTYVLTAVKPKLQKADPASRTRCKTSPAPVQPGSTNTGPPLIQAVCQNITMAQFADELLNMAPSYLHYQPPDETGLAGSWDFTFTFSRSMPGGAGAGRGGRNSGDAAPSASTDAAPDPSGAISLFDALTHQLGLKLDMQKRPVPVLVLDHIEEKPVGN